MEQNGGAHTPLIAPLCGRETKKSAVVLLRWVLIITCSCLILFSTPPGQNHTMAHVLVLLLILSNIALGSVPEKAFVTKYFDQLLVTTDIVLITGCIWLSGQTSSELYMLYFLIIMIAAVGETLRAILWSALLIALAYFSTALYFDGYQALLQPEILIRVPFFFVVALFYGYFAQLVRAERTEKAQYQKQLGAATRIREISALLSRSLDRQIILQTLCDTAREIARVEYTAVISRNPSSIKAESGNSRQPDRNKRINAVSNELGLCLLRQSELAASSDGLQFIEPTVESAANDSEQIADSCALYMFGKKYSFMPCYSGRTANLYLCLSSSVADETAEYLGLLLLSAAMALNNASQYQVLLHEVEKRQDLVKQLGTALEFKSEFVANISHELRTPLYSFIGFGELLLEGGYGSMEEKQAEIIRRMMDNAGSLLELINNILDHTKLEAGEVKIRCVSGELSSFVKEIVATCMPLVRDKPLQLETDCDSTLPPVLTDWSVLRQILLNLVANAIKFTESGVVSISAGYQAERGTLYLRVADTGMGIAADRLTQIFEPFRQLENSYTKRYAGTGLGLAITKKQVEMLGGSITVKSEPNKGTTFSVEFPVQQGKDQSERNVLSALPADAPINQISN